MKPLLDAFWRAAAYCLHPKVIGLSLLPLALSAGLLFGLGWFFWEPAIDAVRAGLENTQYVDAALRWAEDIVGARLRVVVVPLIVLLVTVPLTIVLSLLLVALLMTPAMVTLVATRRFPTLERKHGAGLLRGLLWSLACTGAALVALLISLPLWFIPPLALLLPPLIWGWLTYRVMSFDVWAEHASGTERRTLMQRHRGQLLAIGIVTGYLGAAPTLLFAFSAFTLVMLPFLAPIAVWLYTLIFAFSSLWFTHYCLSALAVLRAESAAAAVPPMGEVIEALPPPETGLTPLPRGPIA
ncbi:EI24 domain-containing protein [Aquabacterium sp.]|uniref:EI24 domain-containing protein n=1 Tax=Aquabacterium sp. TaxID=1872578 RepID=UPI002CCEC2FA|nr:EI24 domain-containing protein [Aquabacterium sp.]HSW05590.1 EI24 domain-containing protein [Aquabacterium sp.]